MADEELTTSTESVEEPYVYEEDTLEETNRTHSLQELTKIVLGSGKLSDLEDVAILSFKVDSVLTDGNGTVFTTLSINNTDAIVILTEYANGSRNITYLNKYGSDLPIVFGVSDIPEDTYVEIALDIGSAVCTGSVKGHKLTIVHDGDKFTYKLED